MSLSTPSPALPEASAAEPSLVLTPRDCPVCGSDDGSHVFAEADFDPAVWDQFAFASRKLPEYMHYRLVSCPDCDLLYASPVPTPALLARAYREAAFDSASEAADASRTYAALLRQLWPVTCPKQGALDIGTGDGVFLERLQEQGFSGVQGVEPSSAPIAAARPEIRPLIRQGMFDAALFAPQQFHLVTCFQTIEHLYEPREICRDAFGLLADGGAFFMVCHNRRALSARVLGFKSPIFDIEHLQLFSPQSARRLLEESGFEDIVVRPIVNRYPLSYLLKLFPLPSSFKKRWLARLQASALGGWHVSVALGNMAVFGTKRG